MQGNTDKFSGKALQYEIGRPGYSKGVADFIKNLVGKSAKIADVGAGTGKFTEVIDCNGNDIIAIEPNLDMFAILSKKFLYSRCVLPLNTSAEMTMLDDDSADVVTVAQALHWFDLDKFKAECQRSLRADGYVVAVYNNTREERTKVNHRSTAVDNFFSNPIKKEYTKTYHYRLDEWLAYATSHSHSPLETDDDYAEFILDKTDYFRNNSVEGKLAIHIFTLVIAQKLDTL
jgi:ubiquinone/menaquinone biosynthesis C-methylase UbiE